MPQASDYKSTLNLPKTSFAMKADLPKREPEMLTRWQSERLYEAVQRARAGAPAFILHDGPPYANGDIHIGHALNKILKDIIVRYKTMRGFRAPYVPGWDCHGMPIEHQLFKALALTKHQIGQADFRAKARAYAQRYVDLQREQFKRLGVAGDWDHPYLTMAPDYELTILQTFKELVKQGAVYHGKKPVDWCATCETALAEAEVEYEDRQDTSIYVAFPVVKWPKQIPESLLGVIKDKPRIAVAVWTTTPWTLPANVALAFHPEAQYVILHETGWPHNLLVAESLAPKLAALLKATGPLPIGGALGKDLKGLRCQRPVGAGESVAVTDEGVSLEEGTGIVHIAPGHGHEDYAIGQANKLETLSPVDHQGRFTKDVPPWAGKSVFEANPLIIADLKARGLVLKEASLTHSYPHCWRCKQPVIFRATAQWFLRVDEALRRRLLASVKQVTWIPSSGASRMSGMLATRPDWCLSRQRYWGTPIPILHCISCDRPLLDIRVIEQVERALGEQGIEAWFTASPEALAPGARCPSCSGTQFRKETDILDVWFDSGVSHEAVLKRRPELQWPASLYLEGSDQHRGWFQVSMIPSVALHGCPPYERVLTHGFVMDGEGRKMSKSLGNVVAPQEVIERYGAEILRLWVAFSDYREDVRISESILERVAEAYRKIRNTFRYLLANLYDFDPARHATPPAAWPDIDRWALQRTERLRRDVTEAYEAYQFHQAFRAIYDYCVLELSAFYLDALKDRLYTEAAGAPRRRCAQSSLYGILATLVRMAAPVLPVTAEEVWQVMRQAAWVGEASVHLAVWPAPLAAQRDEPLEERWQWFFRIREAAMKALEEQRIQGRIGSPLDAQVSLRIREAALRRLCEAHRETLAEALVVSGVTVDAQPADGPARRGETTTGGDDALEVRVERSTGEKCQRCWKRPSSVGRHPGHPQLCERCVEVIQTVTGDG